MDGFGAERKIVHARRLRVNGCGIAAQQYEHNSQTSHNVGPPYSW
jgi:hypothetical protein